MGRVLGTMLGKAEAASGRAALNNDFLPAAFMWDGLRSVLAELYGREDPRDGAALGRAARSLALAGWPGRSVKSHTLGAGGASGPNAAVPCAARASYLSAGSDGRPAGQYPPGEAAFLKRARKRLSRKRG
jgi:hypothetical protein